MWETSANEKKIGKHVRAKKKSGKQVDNKNKSRKQMLKKYKYGKQARNFPVVRFWVKGEGVFFWEKRSFKI